MKKIYKLLFVICIMSMANAISAQVRGPLVAKKDAAINNPVMMTGDEPANGEYVKKIDKRYPDKIIGTSLYDLQTNHAVQRRILAPGNGTVSAVWTMSQDDISAGFPDRGAGMNTYDGSDWGDQPTERIEDARCGWPSITQDADGNTVIISHKNDVSLPYVSIRKAGEDTWSSDIIATAAQSIWPRSAMGGPDGNTLHALSISLPVANQGVLYEGVDGHILYHRSLDGGKTWDINSAIIPGLDSSAFLSMPVDAYSIEARGNTVAVAMYGQWNDIVLFKSLDNGETWTKTIVYDFPLDKYSNDDGYTLDQIGGVDTLGPAGTDPDATEAAMFAVYTSDNAGSLVIDPDGMCHIVYGEMYVADVNLGDGTSSYFPGINGIAYWNEDMGTGTRPQTITGALDLDGDGVLLGDGNGAIAIYFQGLASYPTLDVDNNGKLFLAYSAVAETFVSDLSGEYYRHMYIMSSEDGETWTDPMDVINEDFYKGTDDEGFENEVEAIFPDLASDDKWVYLVFQKDFEPGMNVRAPTGSEDPIYEQEISFLKFDKNLDFVERIVKPSTFDMGLSPNPSNGLTTLNFDLKKSSNARIEVLNMDGKILNSVQLGSLSSGSHQHQLQLDVNPGMYMVKLIVDNSASTLKLLID